MKPTSPSFVSTDFSALKLLMWLVSVIGFATLSIDNILMSMKIFDQGAQELPQLLLQTFIALIFALCSISIKPGNWKWLLMPILAPLLYFTMGNIIFYVG